MKHLHKTLWGPPTPHCNVLRITSQRYCSSQQRAPCIMWLLVTLRPHLLSPLSLLLWFPKYIRHIWVLGPFSCFLLYHTRTTHSSSPCDWGSYGWVCPVLVLIHCPIWLLIASSFTLKGVLGWMINYRATVPQLSLFFQVFPELPFSILALPTHLSCLMFLHTTTWHSKYIFYFKLHEDKDFFVHGNISRA